MAPSVPWRPCRPRCRETRWCRKLSVPDGAARAHGMATEGSEEARRGPLAHKPSAEGGSLSGFG